MRFITRDTDYAIRALIFMAGISKKREGRIITVDEIVDKSDLPKRFLRRILQGLAKKKVLTSHRGKDGGFSFLKPPRKIHLVDIIRIFQGEIDFTNCLLKGDICPDIKRCKLRKKLKEIGLFVKKEFSRITIASLL